MTRFRGSQPWIAALVLLGGIPSYTPPEAHGIDVAGMDRGVEVKSPADMYNFANGTWFDRTSIPADKAYVGSFELVREHNLAILRSVAENAAPDSIVGTLFHEAMNAAVLESQGGKPLLPELARIDAADDRSSIVREIAHLGTLGVQVGFTTTVRPDAGNTSRMVLTISQCGLALPERQLYTEGDDRSKAIRAQYIVTLGKLMALAKESDPAGQAGAALEIERVLARASFSVTELQNPEANYHLTMIPELAAEAPTVDWGGFFTELGAAKPTSMNVCQPRFISAFSKALVDFPVSQWRSYLRASVLYAWSPYLSNDFVKTQGSLINDVTGAVEIESRWKRAIETIDSVAAGALGPQFVAKAFTASSKEAALRLVQIIRSALKIRMQELDWMAPETLRWATAKLEAMVFKVGYPSSWRDYSTLTLAKTSYLDNLLRVQSFNWKQQLAKLGKPANRNYWNDSPLTGSVSYNPVWNEIVVPAGMLQPGFFDQQADEASNYGAIGSIVAHEMTHAVDDLGSQYDATGNMKNWWTPDDKEMFANVTAYIQTQYSSYRSPDDLPVNGSLTLSENVADVGGLNIAYLAYRRALNGATPALRDGLTGDQRFFVAFAQNYRAHYRPDVATVDIRTDPHSPEPVRVQGALSDHPVFYKAFGLAVPKFLPQVW